MGFLAFTAVEQERTSALEKCLGVGNEKRLLKGAHFYFNSLLTRTYCMAFVTQMLLIQRLFNIYLHNKLPVTGLSFCNNPRINNILRTISTGKIYSNCIRTRHMKRLFHFLLLSLLILFCFILYCHIA